MVVCVFKKASLAPSSSLLPGLVTFSLASSSSSSTCSLLPEAFCSSLDDSCRRSDQFCLVPLTLAVEELSPVAGYVGALLHAHCEWFLVSFQDSHFIVISKSFIFCLSSMSVFQMLEEGGLLPDLGCLAVEL